MCVRATSSWMVSSLYAKFVMHIFRMITPRDLVLWMSIDVVCFLSTKWNRADAHINCYGFNLSTNNINPFIQIVCVHLFVTSKTNWYQY
jgi:hypothetical protein